MHGEYKVRVKNSRNSYTFSLRRNITVLRGESGRGKTTLFDMIHEHNRFGKESGVSISCDRELVTIAGDKWEDDILGNPGKIIVIDEDSHFIRSRDFARVVRGSDNYYLLITRNYLSELPISVDEIYELTGAKNKRFNRIYSDIWNMYDRPDKTTLPFKPQVIITEDSGSGYQFFNIIARRMGIQCISSGGKSGVYRELASHPNEKVVVIADGAAFGAEIGDVARQQSLRPDRVGIYLPESFEWVILSSGAVMLKDSDKLTSPEDYADSVDYMSWEQYFTELLASTVKDSKYQKYSKDKLSDYYTQDRVERMIREFIKGIDFT